MINYLITIITWFFSNAILPLFPIEISWFTLGALQSGLMNFRSLVVYIFPIFPFFPVTTFFAVILAYLSTETLLIFPFKVLKFILNLIRGSGA